MRGCTVVPSSYQLYPQSSVVGSTVRVVAVLSPLEQCPASDNNLGIKSRIRPLSSTMSSVTSWTIQRSVVSMNESLCGCVRQR